MVTLLCIARLYLRDEFMLYGNSPQQSLLCTRTCNRILILCVHVFVGVMIVVICVRVRVCV